MNTKEGPVETIIKDLAILEKFDFERPPVGVKFTAVRPEGLDRTDTVRDICEMLAVAQSGEAFYATKDDISCVGPMLLGMAEENPVFESGMVGPKANIYHDERANRRIYQYLPRLRRHSVNYASFAPLNKLTFEPDLLIIMSSVSQAEILNRARAYYSGEAWTAKGTPVAGCAWLYIEPYVTGEINFTVTGFGYGMKARQLFPEGRILMSIPWDRIPELMQNLAEIEWEPESYSIGAEAHKAKMRRIQAEIRDEVLK
jgi:uncharacterized protein (DUF169 family)